MIRCRSSAMRKTLVNAFSATGGSILCSLLRSRKSRAPAPPVRRRARDTNRTALGVKPKFHPPKRDLRVLRSRLGLHALARVRLRRRLRLVRDQRELFHAAARLADGILRGLAELVRLDVQL